MTDTRSSVLITVDELADRIAGEPGLVLLDISDDLETAPLERPVVPGAIAVSLASDISGPASKDGGADHFRTLESFRRHYRASGLMLTLRWSSMTMHPVPRRDAHGGLCAGLVTRTLGFSTAGSRPGLPPDTIPRRTRRTHRVVAPSLSRQAVCR